MLAARADLEGLVGAGVELDEALQEALQAHLQLEVVNSMPAADLYAMYLSLGEVRCSPGPVVWFNSLKEEGQRGYPDPDPETS